MLFTNQQNIIKKIQIPEELMDLIQKLCYEVQSLQQLIGYLLTEEDINEKRLQIFQYEYETKYAMLEIAKREILNEYLTEELQDKNLDFNFNFNNSSIEIFLNKG